MDDKSSAPQQQYSEGASSKQTQPSTEKQADGSHPESQTSRPDHLDFKDDDLEKKNDNIVVNEELKIAEESYKDETGFIFYKCRFCGLTYNYMTTLRAHERVHNIDEPYKCNRCSESFHFMCELEYHAKQHAELKGYKCECGRTFHNYTDLLYHKHPGEEDEVEEIVITVKGKHIPENEFPVPEFIEKGFEPKHPLRVYSDIRVNPYICQYCSKSYPNSRMLAYHMYGHRGEKIFNPRASRYLMARSENSYISPGV